MYIENNRNKYTQLQRPTKKSKKIIWLILLLSTCILFFWWQRPLKKPIKQEDPPKTELTKSPTETLVSYKINEGDIPADIFSTQGKFDANDIETLLLATKPIYDFTQIKVGQTLRFYFDNEKSAKRMEYDRDTERMIIVERQDKKFVAREEKIAYTISQEIARGTIENFFYADALKAGLQETTVLEVGDIFSFNIDFTTEIRVGDEFDFIYEKRSRNGQAAPDGKILAAKFVNDGVTHYAYYFEIDGHGGYYDEEGRVLERQFLKAPLSFRYISSGYTGRRLNPVTRTVMAHYQIDYAASSGTPVVSTARGTIISASWENGWGNIVRIRHDNGYTTHYGHLSAFAKGIHSGVSIAQGQVIGYVGSTGWSTGPHLDFGLKLNGAPVNPLKLDQPKGAPLSADKIDTFKEIQNKYNNQL